jgi:hypothetical protein
VPKVKVRCPQCGAKNDDVEMCRICGMSLPNAAAIRNRAGEGMMGFNESVEHERAAWRDYSEGRMSLEARSRRPVQLPTLPPVAWADPVGFVDGGGDLGNPARGIASSAIGAIVLIVAAIVATVMLFT